MNKRDGMVSDNDAFLSYMKPSKLNLPPQNWATVKKAPSINVILRETRNAMFTAGFIKPPLRWPMVIAKLAMVIPAVSEIRRSGQEVSCLFKVEAQTIKTKMKVAINSPPTADQNSRFLSSSVSKTGMFPQKKSTANKWFSKISGIQIKFTSTFTLQPRFKFMTVTETAS